MTAIAYREGVMACDSCWSSYGSMQAESATKLRRLHSGALLGQAGDNDARAVIALLDRITDPEKLPSREQLAATRTDFEGLLVFPDRRAFIIASCPVDAQGFATDGGDIGVWPAATMGGYAAVGSGAEAALAAMDAGASAKRAVEIACQRNLFCRLPVHTMRLPRRRTR